MRFWSALSAVAFGLTLAAPAYADSPLHLKVDWAKAYAAGMQWLVANGQAEKASTMGPSVGSMATSSMVAGSPIEGRVASSATRSEVVEDGSPWLNAAPHLSVVARDWGEAHLFAGRLSTTDVFRLSRSSRMVVTRIRLGDGIIVPFAQVGLGQWRVDTNVLPGWVCDTEVAAQLGTGFELRIAKAYAIAVESDYTLLYRDQREPQNIPFPRFWGAMAASRVQF